jgi:SAM-dependent methyltransferase
LPQFSGDFLSPLATSHAFQALRFAFWLGFMIYILIQVRKPDRFAGRLFAWIMNISHSRLTNWGVQHVRIGGDSTILDVGCGGGRTIQKLAALAPAGKIYGIDYAKGSVAASSAKNKQLIQSGRVEIQLASVSKLPFPENKFDLVTAVETQYYWPDLPLAMQEIFRVLKPGGTVLIIAESYKKGANNAWQQPVMKLLKSTNLGVDDQNKLFAQAGFSDIEVHEERTKGWICVLGLKPM